jgi:hypothetical protein
MGIFGKKKKQSKQGAKPVQMESVIIKEAWSVLKDLADEYFEHATRAEVHKMNASTALKPDAKSDEAYA